MVFRTDDPAVQAQMESSRNAENRGRRAGVYARYDTTGQGYISFDQRLDFGLSYVEEPFLAYGCKVDIDQVRDELGLTDDANPPALPLCTGYVVDWDQNARGHYVGAWVAITVYYPPTLPPAAQIAIEHFFTFEAVAIKDVPV